MDHQRKPEDFGILDAPRERAGKDTHGGARSEAPAAALAPATGERAATVAEILASNAFGHCVDDDLGGPPAERERREAELEEARQEGVAADFEVDGAGQTSDQAPRPGEEEDADAGDADDYFFPAASDALPMDEPPPPKGGEFGGDGDGAGDDGDAGPPADAGAPDDAPPPAAAPDEPPVTRKSPSRKRK